MTGLLWLVILPGRVVAAPGARLTIQADVSPRRVILGDTVQLSITVKRSGRMGAGGGVVGRVYDRLVPPSMPDFDVLGRSSSESTQVIFGGRGATQITQKVIEYQLRPKRTGRLRIGSARVRLGGQVVSSRPLTVQVLGSGKSLGHAGALGGGRMPGLGAGTGAPGTSPGLAPGNPTPVGDLSIQTKVDHKSVFVGQQVTVSWYLYHTSPLIRFVPQAMPDAAGALVEDLYQIGPQTTSRQQVIGGRLYYVTPLYRKAFFPRKSGTLEISPLKMELTTLAIRYSGVGSVLRASEPVKVDVRPLPDKGKPKDFPSDGRNVGTYAIQAMVDRFRVKAGEAVTLTVKVTVAGHPELVDIPGLDKIGGFKIRPDKPQVQVQSGDQVAGVKTYEYVLIGVKAGQWTIPPFVLHFFDPAEGRYHVTRTKPIALTVVGSLSQDGAEGGGRNVLQVGIRPIHRGVRMMSRIGPTFYSSVVFKILLFLPLVVLVGLLFVERIRRHLSEDTESKRWRRTQGRARRRLRTARRFLDEGDSSGFFAEVARVLGEVLGERLGVKTAGLTSDELKARMVEAGLPEDLIRDVSQELQACDFARFAPAASSREEMERTLDRVRSIVGRVSRSKAA